MKNTLSLTLLGLLLGHGHTLAQSANPAPEATAETPALAPAEMTLAEVRKVDVAAGKLTLKHGEIKNLGMPPMTMVFQVKDPAFLSQVKVGDSVRFTADKVKGAYTVLSLEVVPNAL
jgi:Cu/Ag efflux protein CusF